MRGQGRPGSECPASQDQGESEAVVSDLGSYTHMRRFQLGRRETEEEPGAEQTSRLEASVVASAPLSPHVEGTSLAGIWILPREADAPLDMAATVKESQGRARRTRGRRRGWRPAEGCYEASRSCLMGCRGLPQRQFLSLSSQ